MIDSVNIEDIDLNNSFFHFTARSNIKSIEENGLEARVGSASKMVNDKPRVCMSKGGQGILGVKNSFIYMFKELRICDIPEEYRKYFAVSDFSDTSKVTEELVYDAMEKRFKDEIYLKVDAKEGEDFDKDEIYGLTSDFDIKGKENHNISKDKLVKIRTSSGDTALDVVRYLYNRLLEKNPESESLIKDMNSDLTGFLDYICEKNKAMESNEFLSSLKGKVDSEYKEYTAGSSKCKKMQDQMLDI